MVRRKHPERRCTACGAKVSYRSIQPLCGVCGRSHCGCCGKGLPESDRRRWCPECYGAANARWRSTAKARTDRTCPCGRPIGPGSTQPYCAACHAADFALRLEILARRPDPHCKDCGQPIPGRRSRRCPVCDRKKRESRAPRPCPCCRSVRVPGTRSLCKLCQQTYDRWIEAYRRGDPEARGLRAKRPYHSHQKKEAAPMKEQSPS